MYHGPVHSLAQRVLSHIRRLELLRAGDRVGVAVSGGIDSVGLLRLLLELRGELGIVLSVVHFNHKLRGAESEADQEFVARLAREHDLEFRSDADDVAGLAAEEHIGLEAAARALRYGFFRHLLGEDREGDPQGLKPGSRPERNGTAEAVPFHEPSSLRSDSRLRLLNSPRLDKIVTGHTLDDQAETVLMRMIRGAGSRGLGGIHPRLAVEDESGEVCGEIVRPLLEIRRRELEQYLHDLGQSWREDASNADTTLTRNRVRRLLVPLLENEFNPAVAANLAELSEIARGEEDYWENEVAGWMGTAVHWSEPVWALAVSPDFVQISLGGPRAVSSKDADLRMKIDSAPWLVMNASVDLLWLLGEPVAVQRRLVKAIGDEAGVPLEFNHVEEVLRFAAASRGADQELSLPRGWAVVREPDHLVFRTPDLREPVKARDYEYDLVVPGQTIVPEADVAFETRRVMVEAGSGYNPDHLLEAESLPGPLRVRNWRPGDRFWPAHTKSPKKLKELLQESRVAQAQRGSWPVVIAGGEIVWVRGFAVPARYRAKTGREALLISEQPLAGGTSR